MTTLDEALTEGRGNERPFRCPEHEDRHASASVNVLKGVWYCYSCQARGTVDGKKAPSAADLMQMIEPEGAVRVYPEGYLALFDPPDTEVLRTPYWQTRFPEWLCRLARLGNDPFTGHATFPVRTPDGRLAGVGRRDPDPEAQPRYRYPPRWSAAAVLHGAELVPRMPVVVLTEGAADAVSLWEVGIPALACYGSGLHHPQREQLLRRAPKRVLLGFDMDPAGQKAAVRTQEVLEDTGLDLGVIEWPAKDPGDCSPEQRLAAVAATVGDGRYNSEWTSWRNAMQTLNAAA